MVVHNSKYEALLYYGLLLGNRRWYSLCMLPYKRRPLVWPETLRSRQPVRAFLGMVGVLPYLCRTLS